MAITDIAQPGASVGVGLANMQEVIGQLLADAADQGRFEEVLRYEVQEMFETEGGTGQGSPWKRSRRAIRGWKRVRGKRVSSTPLTLVDTGRMRDSLVIDYVITPGEVQIELGFAAKSRSGERYPAKHMFGADDLPIRNPGFPMPETDNRGLDMERIVTEFYDALGQLLGG